MKKYQYLFVMIFLVGILFSACNKIKESINVKIGVNYETSMNFDIPDGSRNMFFSNSKEIDPFSSSTYKKYEDKIKKIEIVSLSAEITSISKEIDIVSGTVSVFNDNRTTQWTLKNVPLAVGNTIELNNDDGQWNTISDMLSDKKIFTEKVEGESSEGGVTFTLKVKMKTKITVEPL